MNIRWNSVLGLVSLCLLGWYYSLNQDDSDLQSLVKTPDSPDYIGNKMETTVFSPEGKKQYLAFSEKVEHFGQNGKTNFTAPLVYLFNFPTDNSVPKNESVKLPETQSWKLSALNAVLTRDEMLYLTGDVVVESLTPASRLQRIETESATVNLKTQDITSDEAVKINGQNFNSTGLKMVGNLRQQAATLKEQVKTYYEISKP